MPPAASGVDVVTLASFGLTLVVLVGLWFAKVLRPGALGKNGLRKLAAHPWWVWLLCGFMIFYCGQVGGLLVAMAPRLTGPGPPTSSAVPPLRYEAVLQLAVYFTSLAAAGVLVRLLKASAPQAGLTVTWKSLLVGAVCLLMAVPVVNSVGVLAVAVQEVVTKEEISTHLAHPVLESLHSNLHEPWAWVVAGVAVLLAPIQEEVLFRGFLQTSLVRLTGRPWVSILIASVVFGAAHVGPMPWYAVVSIFVLGLGMGLAFEKTRSLGTAIAMHVGFNAVNVALAVLSPGS